MTEPLILFDRSRVTTDWDCRRKRYLNYEYKGKGLASDTMHLEFYLGIVVHDGLSAIARGVGIDDIADAARVQMMEALLKNMTGDPDAETFAAEQGALVEGLLRGFHRQVWPRMQAEYPKIVHIEEEMLFPISQLRSVLGMDVAKMAMMSKSDLILEDKGGDLWYVEYKTTSSAKDDWINSWSTAVQIHSSIRAAEATTGRKVAGVIIQGLYKGYVSYGKQGSPFCYSYYRPGNPPFTKEERLYEYKAGYKKSPVWEQPGGVKEWVANMPEQLLAEQFPQTAPIFINDDLIDAFFRQTTERELEIHMASTALLDGPDDPEHRQRILDLAFPQNFSKCQPGWGKPCQYRKICHGRETDPMQLGFTWRTPHHEPELKQWEAADAVANQESR